MLIWILPHPFWYVNAKFTASDFRGRF